MVEIIIPEDWKIQNITNNSTLKARIGWQGLTTAEYKKNGKFYLITGTDFNDGKINWENCAYVDEKRYSQDKNIQLRQGDVLVTKDGTIGKIAYIDTLPLPATLNSGVFVIRPIGKEYLPLFLFYILYSDYFTKFLNKLKAGSTINHLYQKDFVSFNFVVPPYPEQEKISQVLLDIDKLIEKLNDLIIKKKNIRQGTMQELLTGKRRLHGFEEKRGNKESAVGLIPEDWDIKPLKKISTMSGRIGWQGLKQSEFTQNPDEPFLITGMNFEDHKIRWQEVYHISQKRYEEATNIQLRRDDVLMTKDGTIGKLLYVDEIPYPGKASLNSHLLVFRPVSGQYVPKFLFYQLSSKAFLEHVELNKSGSTFFGITQEAVSKYNAYLPSIPEQSAIAEVLSDMDTEIDELEKNKEKYIMIKKGMMQKLLTGEIRLR